MMAIGGYYSSGAYPWWFGSRGSKMSKRGTRGLLVRVGEETRLGEAKRRLIGNGDDGDGDGGRLEACIHPYLSRGGYWDFDYLF